MKLRAFSKTYAGRCVLDWPETELEKGKRYAIIGANGSGKSTLARCLAGVLQPDDGAALLREGRIGYMPQKSYAFRMSVEENLCLTAAARVQREEMLQALGLDQLRRVSGKKLSGGETARLALGRVLLGTYDVLLLDEPTASMDMASTHCAEGLIKDYCRKRGSTLILITHSLRQAQRMADEVLFLDGGRLVERGKTDAMLHSPQQEATRMFLDFYGLS